VLPGVRPALLRLQTDATSYACGCLRPPTRITYLLPHQPRYGQTAVSAVWVRRDAQDHLYDSTTHALFRRQRCVVTTPGVIVQADIRGYSNSASGADYRSVAAGSFARNTASLFRTGCRDTGKGLGQIARPGCVVPVSIYGKRVFYGLAVNLAGD
jgi:hypothetical protein